MSETLLHVEGLGKTFAVPVLSDLDFTLHAGEVHALMGSNGAGKSTLCNIIAGIHHANSGSMRFRNAPFAPASVKAAENAGVRMVMQELNLFPTLSVAENLFFKSLSRRLGIINHAHLRRRADDALARVGLNDIDPGTSVGELGVGQQQLVEIASVLADPVQLLILDEPTAALTDPQIDLLFTQLQSLKKQGVGIIYISHRMDEIRTIADRVSVLRDGRMVATQSAAEIKIDTLIELMAGEDLTNDKSRSQSDTPNPGAHRTVLTLENFGRDGVFQDINLEIRAGEILGIGGLIGSRRTEVLRAIFGADRADRGTLHFPGNEKQKRDMPMRSPREAMAHGIGMVVEDRKSEGLLLDKTLIDNISIGTLPKLSNRIGLVNRDQEIHTVEQAIASLAIKCDQPEQIVATLSGGNQQKALIARWLLGDLKILLFDEPTRGVDARAKSAIHALIRELAAHGKAIVFVSSETRELLELADRVVVMSNGRVAGEFNSASLDEETLLEASFRFYQRPDTSTHTREKTH